MLRRPKKDDTEEEILEMEKQYMAEKEKSETFKPTVNIINLRKHKAELPLSVDTSKQIKSESNPIVLPSAETSSSKELNDDKVYYPTLLPKIMGDIVEKNINDTVTQVSVNPVKSRQLSSKPPSVFSQRSRRKNVEKMSTEPSSSTKIYKKIDSIGDHSVIVKGEEAVNIHNENMAVLQKMSEEEILSEQQKLISTLDPKLVQFVKSLKNQRTVQKSTSEPEKMQDDHIPDTSSIIDTSIENDIISHPRVNDWMHFDILENDKLEWMKSFKTENSQNPESPYEARFNFSGHLLPYIMEYNEENKSLFHHADEPHRPGYTLNELIQFCRSTVIQQRTLALNTLAGILDYYDLGLYDGMIEIPITKIFFILRFSIDENIQIVLEPALKAMSHLLYNKVDEHYIDLLLCTSNGLVQPGFQPSYSEMDEKETDLKELKDFHIAELDLIRACVRTDVIQRIYYIINTIKPEYSSINYCLQILIALTRHSTENCEKLFNTPGFIECIFENLLSTSSHEKDASKDTGKNKVICSALKLIRIISSQSMTFSKIFIEKFKVLDILLHFIGNITISKMSLMSIQIEAFYLFCVYCNYKFGMENIAPLILPLCKTIRDYIETINMNEYIHNIFYMHATALVTFFSYFFSSFQKNLETIELSKIVDDCIKNALIKWSSQLLLLEKYSIIQTNLLSSIFNCSIALSNIYPSKATNDVHHIIQSLIKSIGFATVCDRLSEFSNLLAPLTLADVKKTNLIRLNAHSINYTILPVINEYSPVSFISVLSNFLKMNQFENEIICLLTNLSKYLSRIITTNTLNLLDNWFTRMELNMLYNILHSSTSVFLNEDQKDIIYNISFKLSYLLPSSYEDELRFIFENIIFEKKWFTVNRMMNNMKMDDVSHLIDNLESIKKLYIGYIGPKGNQTDSITISFWNRVIMPKDWIYLPILELYSKSQDLNLQKLLTKDLLFGKVENSLKWILMMETSFADITADIPLTDRFCRLICVFLLDNSLFLDPTIKYLLQKCIKVIFDLEKSDLFNFDKPLIGINNFQDLYSQILDQYQAVSYGDNTFAACVLVPLAQKHNIKWRKLVWSEYAGCLRSLDCPDEMLCYPLSDYLNPPEKDFSLLKCYHRALNSNILRTGTVSYKIALHHVTMIKQSKNVK